MRALFSIASDTKVFLMIFPALANMVYWIRPTASSNFESPRNFFHPTDYFQIGQHVVPFQIHIKTDNIFWSIMERNEFRVSW